MAKTARVPEEIVFALARGATLVTGRQRAARSLRQEVDQANREAGLSGWAPARVLAWDTWTAGLWRQLVLRGDVSQILLNRTQERSLWRRVIEADAEELTLRSASSLAASAGEAWGALSRYGGLKRLKSSTAYKDAEVFAGWGEAFQSHCLKQGYVPQSQLEDALRRTWREIPGSLPAERDVMLCGFERMLPAQRWLLDDLRAAGCVVREVQRSPLAAKRWRIAAEHEAEEIEAAALWIRQVLEAKPETTVGVIVPGLEGAATMRAAIDRVFRQVLAPEAQEMRVGETALPYEFSTGTSLDRTEVGRVAIALLEWAQQEIGADQITSVLLSPAFAGGAEVVTRAEFDAYELRTRTVLRPEMRLEEIEELVAKSKRRGGLVALLACLRRMQAIVRRGLNGKKTHGEWAETMRDLLEAAGWAATADSVGFQARERWESALDELGTLDFEGERVSYAEALRALREIAESTTFAPESHDASVQIMGPEEAAGSRFDAVWFLRAGELHWPKRAAGSPLLPWPLRRELGMPGSDAGAEADDARQATESIVASCDEIVFSYAKETPDGRQRPAAMLAAFGLQVLPRREAARAERVRLEVFEDEAGLAALPEGRVGGGAGVLEAQAACGFHAFARYRLFASELETRTPGVNASERGRVVHAMLEHFWARVETQSRLRAMTAEERRTALEEAVGIALEQAGVAAGSDWEAAYLEAQRQRLLRLGLAWLEVEAARKTAFRVARREGEEKSVRIGPLTVNLRIDRVDETAEGAVLIDYKTGKVTPGSWSGDRPDQPQLPLYAALTSGERLHAVAFGVVRAGKDMKLTGYEARQGTLSGKAVAMEMGSLEEQVDQWRDVLEGLANDFARGDARVSPKVYPGSCQYCAHRLICRVDAASLDSDDEDDWEPGEQAFE